VGDLNAGPVFIAQGLFAARDWQTVAFCRNWAYFTGIMKFLMVWIAFALSCAAAQNQASTQNKPETRRPRLLIGDCAEDGFQAFIPDDEPRARIARMRDLDVEAGFGSRDGDGATFWFVRKGKAIYSFKVKDLNASEVWIAAELNENPNGGYSYNHIALTYSDGGAIGAFHVRVFEVNGDAVTDVSKAIRGAVANFKARHYCKERGNNVTALKWINGELLLMTEVYPTGDCGTDLGHIEAYRVSMPDGKIQEHLTMEQLKRYPGVCLQNDDEN
jgi:hypothetical protein